MSIEWQIGPRLLWIRTSIRHTADKLLVCARGALAAQSALCAEPENGLFCLYSIFASFIDISFCVRLLAARVHGCVLEWKLVSLSIESRTTEWTKKPIILPVMRSTRTYASSNNGAMKSCWSTTPKNYKCPLNWIENWTRTDGGAFTMLCSFPFRISSIWSDFVRRFVSTALESCKMSTKV